MVLRQGTERHRSDWAFREVRVASYRRSSAARGRDKPGTLGWSETASAGSKGEQPTNR